MGIAFGRREKIIVLESRDKTVDLRLPARVISDE
jgi:hypothetical protein